MKGPVPFLVSFGEPRDAASKGNQAPLSDFEDPGVARRRDYIGRIISHGKNWLGYASCKDRMGLCMPTREWMGKKQSAVSEKPLQGQLEAL